jgi:hypothetical protein
MALDDQDEQAPGVRFELRLRTSDANSASYDVSMRSQGSEWNGAVDLVPPSGEVEYRFDGDSPPVACLNIMRAVLRTIFRERERAGFPRRVTRWRPLPSAPAEKHE